jgi:DNA-directed RNA polymerase specialized sigma24 family protein
MTTPKRNEPSTDCPQSIGGARSTSLPLLGKLEETGLDPLALAELPSARLERIGALTERARCDERAAISLLLLLEPELESIGRHMVRRGAEPDEAEAETITVAWEVVSGRRGRLRSTSATTLVNAIWTEVRRDAGHRRRAELEVDPLPEDFDVVAPGNDPLERGPQLLEAAVAAGVVTAEGAALVAQTRIEGRSLGEVAEILGRRYDAVRMERTRAEAALRAFAPSYLSGGGS